MPGCWARRLLILTTPVLPAMVVACSPREATTSPAAELHLAATPSYSIKLKIGPVAAMQGMTTIDQGLPVNHHLAFHIFRTSDGARVTDVRPTLEVIDQASGAARSIPAEQHSVFTLACLETAHLAPDLHFGDDIHLANGNYSFRVNVGQETGIFRDIVVK
ncbi:MAG: hypothetical protein HY535_06775 [Chloroflexi bacterium]|nr:hypothetical protein [Chloroflexota bacterium]